MSDNPFIREDDEVQEAIADQEHYNRLVTRKGLLMQRLKTLKAIPDNAVHPDSETRDGWIVKLEQELKETMDQIHSIETI